MQGELGGERHSSLALSTLLHRRALLACMREIAVDTTPLLRGSREPELLACVWAVFNAVEHARLDVVHTAKANSGCEPRGGIW